MNKTILQQLGIIGCVTIAAIGAAPSAQAQCGASMVKATVAAQTLPSMAQSVQRLTSHFSNQASFHPEARRVDATIIGLWHITFVSAGQTVDEAFDVWHGDGTEILNDTPPPSTGNICVGVWAPTGVLTYRLYHPSWTFDDRGNLTGTAIIREEVALDANGNSFSGTFTVDVLDLKGTNLMHLAGTVTAQRLTVD